MTNSAMASQVLMANHALKSQIKEWHGQSHAQCAVDRIAEVMLADDPKEVERQLVALTQYVGHSKVVVQPQMLQKLRRVLADGTDSDTPSSVQEALRAFETECQVVVIDFAAQLREQRRDQGIAAAAVVVARDKLAQLDIDIAATEWTLTKLKKDRAEQAKDVLGLEQVERECEASVAQVEHELGGYPEPLDLLAVEEQKEFERTGNDGEQRADFTTQSGATSDVDKYAETPKTIVDRLSIHFVRSRRFKALAHEVFLEMDEDGTGALKKVDIYCAVLRLYTKIIKFCSNAEPPSRREVDLLAKTFRCRRARFATRFDTTICEAEFVGLATALCENVAVRRMVQNVAFVIAAPIVGRLIEFMLDRATPGFLTRWIPLRNVLKGPRNALVLSMICAFAMPQVLDWVWKQRRRRMEVRAETD
jgi:hypothetical protein